MTITFDPPTPHAYVVATILANGGSVVASFTLDAEGRTVGARQEGNRFYRCSACGQDGHSRARCGGEGKAPRETYEQRRQGERIRKLAAKADYDLETARGEIARRIAERGRK